MSTCTLGQGPFPLMEHPGPIGAYLLGSRHGEAVIPAWFGDYLREGAAERGYPAPDLTPIYPYREEREHA